MVIFKVIFKNNIGKILYDANISAKFSKLRKIEEKAYKNQLKIAVCKMNPDTKKAALQFCLINFHRNDDLVAFEKEFTGAMEALKQKSVGKE